MFGLRDVVDDAGLTIGGGNSTFHSALMSRFISSWQEKNWGGGERNYEGMAARAGGRVVIIILLLLHLVLRSSRTHFAPANNGLITECGAESGQVAVKKRERPAIDRVGGGRNSCTIVTRSGK